MNKLTFFSMSLVIAVGSFLQVQAAGDFYSEKMQQLGANFSQNAVDKDGNTALHRFAASCGKDKEIFEQFIKKHNSIPNPLRKNKQGQTAQDIAENWCDKQFAIALSGLTLGYQAGVIDMILENNKTTEDPQ